MLDEIACLVSEAEAVGVKLELDLEDDFIWLSRIERQNAKPGVGKEILMDLMSIAEDIGVPIRAHVVECNESLLNYYQDIGFQLVDSSYDRTTKSEKITIEYAV
jgi:hypothetical protein